MPCSINLHFWLPLQLDLCPNQLLFLSFFIYIILTNQGKQNHVNQINSLHILNHLFCIYINNPNSIIELKTMTIVSFSKKCCHWIARWQITPNSNGGAKKLSTVKSMHLENSCSAVAHCLLCFSLKNCFTIDQIKIHAAVHKMVYFEVHLGNHSPSPLRRMMTIDKYGQWPKIENYKSSFESHARDNNDDESTIAATCLSLEAVT